MPQPREITDTYRLERILTSSHSASILRATALASGQTVAIKLINVPPAATAARAAALADRFTGYVAALGALRHPNLPTVLDGGITPDGGAFLVMELLTGETFDHHDLATGGTPEEILPLLGEALAALEELARHGLAHLNVAPENLLLVPAGLSDTRPAAGSAGGRAEKPAVKLLGLGTPLFHLGEAWGDAESARFRAPELALPAAALTAIADWHADCYSLALTTCNALGATVAFGDASGPIVQMPLALSFELANDEALRQILEQSLRRVPAQRPAHAAIRAAFSLALGQPPGPAAAPPPPAPPGRAAGSAGPAAFRERPAAGAAGAPAPAAPQGPQTPQTPQSTAGTAGAHRPPKTLAELMDLEPSLFPTSAAPPAGRAPQPPGPALPAQAAAPGLPYGAAAHAGLEPPAAGGGGNQPQPHDSFFDLLAVPPTLPDLAGGEPLPAVRDASAGAFGAPGGQEGSPTAAEMAAALGLQLGGEPQTHGQLASPSPLSAPALDWTSAAGSFAGLGEAGALPAGPSPFDAAPDAGWPAAAGTAWEAPAQPPGLAAPLPRQTGAMPVIASQPAQPGPTAPARLGSLPGQAGPPGAAGPAFTAGPAGPAGAAGTAGMAAAAAAFGGGRPAGGAGPSMPSPAAPAPPAAPEPPAPASSGEMLSAVDDLLGALPPPPTAAPAPAAAPKARGARSRTAPPPPPAATGPRSDVAVAAVPPSLAERLSALPRPVVLGGGAGLLAVLLLGGFLFFRHRSAGETALAAAGQGADGDGGSAAPVLHPGRPAEAKFFDARSYLIMGRDWDGRVRQALRELSHADQGELGEAGCRQLASIEQTLALSALETLPQDLASGVRNGDLETLQAVVDSASDADVPPAGRSDFERAKGLVRLYEQAQAAAAGGDQAQVLERFHAMDGLSRTLRDPLDLRVKAAAALEAEADALARDGRYDEAVGRLEPIRRSWPERAGLKDLLKTYETAAASEKEQQAILDNVPNFLRRRKPSEGLDLLLPLKPTPHLAQRIAEAIGQLQAQLAQLDAQPPQVKLRDGYLLDYSRGQVVTLSFRVTDDYQVKSVRFFARPEGGRMRELPLQKVGLGYTIDIPPSFHQNGTVEFYVVATDLSGHEGDLGSAEHPQQLRRRQGFERLLR
jgi:hypothetical protein